MKNNLAVPIKAINESNESKHVHEQPGSECSEACGTKGFDKPMPKADKYSDERVSDAIPDAAVASGVIDENVLPG